MQSELPTKSTKDAMMKESQTRDLFNRTVMNLSQPREAISLPVFVPFVDFVGNPSESFGQGFQRCAALRSYRHLNLN